MTSLRPALPSDSAALWALRTRAVRISCATHYAPDQIAAWAATPEPASYAAMLGQGGIVAMADAAIAGYAMLDLARQEVDAVFVDPDCAGRGVGRQLMAALEALARQHGITRLQLSASLNAAAFYRSAGFVALREEVYAHRSGLQLASVVMEKPLACSL